jgi:cell division protein ZapE
MMLDVKGCTLLVLCAAHGVAWFGFRDLCANAVGAIDYLAVAERFGTVIVEGGSLALRRTSATRPGVSAS